MKAFNPDVIVHGLNVGPTFKPVKQKKRAFAFKKIELPRWKF